MGLNLPPSERECGKEWQGKKKLQTGKTPTCPCLLAAGCATSLPHGPASACACNPVLFYASPYQTFHMEDLPRQAAPGTIPLVISRNS